jgi:hypothetical protein
MDDDRPRGEEEEEGSASPCPPREGSDRWRTESVLGGVATGVARGLKHVFAPDVDQPVIVASIPSDPPDPDSRVRVILDPDDPTKSVAIVPEDLPDPPPG